MGPGQNSAEILVTQYKAAAIAAVPSAARASPRPFRGCHRLVRPSAAPLLI